VSQCTKRDLISEFGTPEEKISVCYVGVSRSYSVPVYEEEISQFIGEYSLPKDYLLFIGNLKPHKNVSGLIEAWAKLPDSVRPVLLIVGEGKKYRLSLERRIQSLGRAKEVFFTGSLPEDSMRPLYRCATACVQPSWYEGFGSPPLEAMASGIPVAVSNRGSLPEIASDAALVFDPGDAESFRHALEKILTDQDLRRSLMEKGLRRAQEFTWERTALMTLQTYREIIQKD
ncbi:MAG TPA: glycosyltransferase family 1 protein, partial [Bacteroidetes bacterium]|nr:glycosyltransferase family 1 protein [Bacteroidota bacterium]